MGNELQYEVTSDKESTIGGARNELASALNFLRKELDTKMSNASIISILQNNPCRLKCGNEIKNRVYGKDNIDSFYSGRHDWIRRKLIDAIVDEFSDLTKIQSEYHTGLGRLDIAVLPDKIELRYGRKIIALEIKSGHTVDSKLFNQVQRYLTEVDLLIIIRVPTNDVVPIEADSIKDVLISDVKLLTRKANKIRTGDLTKVLGEWCRGCNANCEHKKLKTASSHHASFEGYETYTRSVNTVVEKTIAVLRKELAKPYSPKGN